MPTFFKTRKSAIVSRGYPGARLTQITSSSPRKSTQELTKGTGSPQSFKCYLDGTVQKKLSRVCVLAERNSEENAESEQEFLVLIRVLTILPRDRDNVISSTGGDDQRWNALQ